MSIVTIHQPAYLPWLGYLEKIKNSDVYVFLDSVQFEKNSFTNRNQINSPNGPLWLTVPVKAKNHLQSTLETLEIDYSKEWRKEHLRSIEQIYARAPFFKERIADFSKLYAGTETTLSDLCFNQLFYWLKIFEINSEVLRSSKLQLVESKSELVLAICRKLQAKTYISGALGKEYLDRESFYKSGIELVFQEFEHPHYSQHIKGAEFRPFLSAVDALFNVENLPELIR